MIKFFCRLIDFMLMFFCFLLPMMIIGAIILLFVCPFMPKDKLQLPKYFRWWDNVDSYIGRDTRVYQSVCQQGWWARYCWLAWRNPINYFDYVHLGLKWNGTELYDVYNSNEDDVGDGTYPGWRHIEVVQYDGKEWKPYFEYYLIYKYPFAPKYCLRFRCGWKIGDNKNKPDTLSQWCLVFNPLMPYTGH